MNVKAQARAQTLDDVCVCASESSARVICRSVAEWAF